MTGDGEPAGAAGCHRRGAARTPALACAVPRDVAFTTTPHTKRRPCAHGGDVPAVPAVVSAADELSRDAAPRRPREGQDIRPSARRRAPRRLGRTASGQIRRAAAVPGLPAARRRITHRGRNTAHDGPMRRADDIWDQDHGAQGQPGRRGGRTRGRRGTRGSRRERDPGGHGGRRVRSERRRIWVGAGARVAAGAGSGEGLGLGTIVFLLTGLAWPS